MRKFAVVLMSAVLGFSAVGCGGGDKPKDTAPVKPADVKDAAKEGAKEGAKEAVKETTPPAK